MSDNWQVGDLALCVSGPAKGENDPRRGFAKSGHKLIRTGGMYTVERVLVWGGIWTTLVLEGHHSTHPSDGWMASSFRKVTPPQADGFDKEVIELMTKKKVDTPA